MNDEIYYHASQIGGLSMLKPHISNHGVSLVYLSKKRENVLVYLSNAIEKYCKKTGFAHDRNYEKWGPYGFDKEGKQYIEEYYSNALIDTYRNISGYIYRVKSVVDSGFKTNIPDAVTSKEVVEVFDVEYIEDAYEEILKAEKEGLIKIVRFEEMTDKRKEWLKTTIKEEYKNAVNHPEYRHFLKAKFPSFIDN